MPENIMTNEYPSIALQSVSGAGVIPFVWPDLTEVTPETSSLPGADRAYDTVVLDDENIGQAMYGTIMKERHNWVHSDGILGNDAILTDYAIPDLGIAGYCAAALHNGDLAILGTTGSTIEIHRIYLSGGETAAGSFLETATGTNGWPSNATKHEVSNTWIAMAENRASVVEMISFDGTNFALGPQYTPDEAAVTWMDGIFYDEVQDQWLVIYRAAGDPQPLILEIFEFNGTAFSHQATYQFNITVDAAMVGRFISFHDNTIIMAYRGNGTGKMIKLTYDGAGTITNEYEVEPITTGTVFYTRGVQRLAEDTYMMIPYQGTGWNVKAYWIHDTGSALEVQEIIKVTAVVSAVKARSAVVQHAVNNDILWLGGDGQSYILRWTVENL